MFLLSETVLDASLDVLEFAEICAGAWVVKYANRVQGAHQAAAYRARKKGANTSFCPRSGLAYFFSRKGTGSGYISPSVREVSGHNKCCTILCPLVIVAVFFFS